MITQKGNKIYRRQDKELLCIEPWGKNSFRVRATQRYEFVPEDISALLPPQECKVKVLKRMTARSLKMEKSAVKLHRPENCVSKIRMENCY